MRIAQVAPLWELVPPDTYGGSELVVCNITEELVKRGYDVTLFAAAGSQTRARLIECAPQSLRSLESQIEKDKTHCTVMGYELKMLGDVFMKADQFDIIHNHVGFQALPFANFVDIPVVTTLHNALDPEVVRRIYMNNAHLPYVSISDYQQKLWPELNYACTVYHGIDLDRFQPDFNHEDKNYLAFLGRLSPEKGPHHAIAIAKALNMKLLLAGKIDRVDKAYWDSVLAHQVDGEQICYLGELNHEQKVEFLRNAAATLCPVEWPEPFGLVLIESMACGTPVFALRDGSIPEVINHGKTGYVADSVDEMIDAVRRLQDFDRREVRRIAEQRFSISRMVDDYLRLYERLTAQTTFKQAAARKSKYGYAPQPFAHQGLTASQVAEIRHSAISHRPATQPRKDAQARKEKLASFHRADRHSNDPQQPSSTHPDALAPDYYTGH